MTANAYRPHPPTDAELGILRRSLTLQLWLHQRQRTSMPTRQAGAPNLRLTNLCESGEHDRCWDVQAGPGGQYGRVPCHCLCHRANLGAWLAYTEGRDSEQVVGYINPDGSGRGDWSASLPAAGDELDLRAQWGDR